MISRFFLVLMLATATAASADNVYKTVTSDGKVVYSNTYSPSDALSRPSQMKINPNGPSIADNSDTRPSGQGVQSGCKADIHKSCGQSGDDNQTFECLLDHQQDVSDACYNAMKKQTQAESSAQGNEPSPEAQNSPPPALQSCKQDVKQFCGNVQRGGGRIINCLMDHQNDISDACYDALSQKKMKKGQQ